MAATPTRTTRVTDDDIEAARHQVDRAFALLGLVNDKSPVCPECGTAKRGKVTLRNDKGYWKCFRCDAWGSPLKLLEKHGYSFVDAVNVLNGRPGSAAVKLPEKVEMPVAGSGFNAVVDPEVYAAIMTYGAYTGAARYYATWHIAPDAVRRSGAVRIDDPARMAAELTATFGRQRLIDAGVVKPAEDTPGGHDYWLVNATYPVVEPHRLPDGTVVGMQLRPSESQLAKVEAHKKGEGPYVPKFLSLRGAGPDSLVGCGLDVVAGLDNAPVYIVEGFKDMLAVMTMGGNAYAIPGAAANVPPVAVDVLRRNRPIVALDRDDAGEAGTRRLVETLTAAGVVEVAVKTDIPAGMDPTDVLIARHVRAGCTCPTCTARRG